MTTTSVTPPPSEIRLRRAAAQVELTWPDGRQDRLDFAALRAACACSSCTQRQRGGNRTSIHPAVAVVDIQPMGVSGIQLFFSDGHSRGHYPWSYLRLLGEATA